MHTKIELQTMHAICAMAASVKNIEENMIKNNESIIRLDIDEIVDDVINHFPNDLFADKECETINAEVINFIDEKYIAPIMDKCIHGICKETE